MYYVEIPATWVDEKLRTMAEEQLVETCDIYALKPIDIHWIRGVEQRVADMDEPWKASREAFVELGLEHTYPRSGRTQKTTMGILRGGSLMFLRAEPEMYHYEDDRGDFEETLRTTVIHECVHAYQHMAGYWDQMTNREQEAMADDVAYDYCIARQNVLRWRQACPEAWFVMVPELADGRLAQPNPAFLERAGVTLEEIGAAFAWWGERGSVVHEYQWNHRADVKPSHAAE